ncbi:MULTISPECIES: YqzE family protein [Bacillus]|uniref:YqzE family protein n=1 Tax=Bacillus TaxID=1386 RepID=UPI000BB9B06C|nr:MULTISPECIES: YqzE family protein [Bacillus]
MKTNDYVKYVTEQLVNYMDKPKEVRKELKTQRKLERDPMVNQLFGVIPLSIMLFVKNRKNKKKI